MNHHTNDHTTQPQSTEDNTQTRITRRKQALEEETQEYDRHQRAIEETQELMWDQHKHFSHRLSDLGERAIHVLKAGNTRAADHEYMQSLSRIINACDEHCRYLAHRNERQLQDIRDCFANVHRSRVQQLDDENHNEHKKAQP